MHAIEKFTALISGFGIFGLMLIGVVQIFGRKFFNAPIFGYIDIVEIAMSALVFLGLAYTERLGGHIRMELFVSHPARGAGCGRSSCSACWSAWPSSAC